MKLIGRRQNQAVNIYAKIPVDSFVSSFRQSFCAEFSGRGRNQRKLGGGDTFYFLLIYLPSNFLLSLGIFRMNLISISFDAIGRRDLSAEFSRAEIPSLSGKIENRIFLKNE